MTSDTSRESDPAESEPQEIVELAGSLKWGRIVTFPALTAFVLGLLYLAGSITRSAELSHSGVPVTIAFPLIPISEELARGLQIMVQTPIVIFALGLVFYVIVIDTQLRRPPKPTTRPKLARGLKFAGGVAVLAFGYLAPVVMVGELVGTAITIGVFYIALPKPFSPRTHRLQISSNVVVIAVVIAYASSAVVTELISPGLLPRATLAVEHGPPIAGSLITFSDGNWYLGEPQHQIRVVDGSRVVSAQIRQVHPRHDLISETLLQLIRNS
jgi:hypothetical protein